MIVCTVFIRKFAALMKPYGVVFVFEIMLGIALLACNVYMILISMTGTAHINNTREQRCPGRCFPN